MKILQVISSLDPNEGGPVEGIKQQASYLIKAGIEVDVICGDSPDSPWLVKHDYSKVYVMGPTWLKYRFSMKLFPWLRANSSSYDAVIVNGLWQYHSLAVWLAMAGDPTPYFVFTHGMLDPWFKRTYPIKHFKKMLYWHWAEYRVLRDARRVMFTCDEERLEARKSFGKYKVNEAIASFGTSHPPGDEHLQIEAFLALYPKLRGKRIILFLSRIHEKKGCDILIDAFAVIAANDPRLHLVIAGPDQAGWCSDLEIQAKRLGIQDRVSWPGMLLGDQKWGAFRVAEVFCLPSHQENFGIVVAEALACGKPVIISNKVNIWREIEADNAGLVGNDTLEGTVESLRRWLTLTPQAYDEMSANAKKCFSSRFSIEKSAKSLLEIIQL